jgi:hypothetical protein
MLTNITINRLYSIGSTSQLRSIFIFMLDTQHAMVAGGFGPYHLLWHGGTPTKRTCIISTTWTMPHALGLDKI